MPRSAKWCRYPYVACYCVMPTSFARRLGAIQAYITSRAARTCPIVAAGQIFFFLKGASWRALGRYAAAARAAQGGDTPSYAVTAHRR